MKFHKYLVSRYQTNKTARQFLCHREDRHGSSERKPNCSRAERTSDRRTFSWCFRTAEETPVPSSLNFDRTLACDSTFCQDGSIGLSFCVVFIVYQGWLRENWTCIEFKFSQHRINKAAFTSLVSSLSEDWKYRYKQWYNWGVAKIVLRLFCCPEVGLKQYYWYFPAYNR